MFPISPKPESRRRLFYGSLALFTAYFARAGINIHAYKIYIPVTQHRSMSNAKGYIGGGPWNQAWRDFRTANPNPTRQQLFEQRNRMIVQFGIYGGLVPYRPPSMRPR
jgi:hypothetical protein